MRSIIKSPEPRRLIEYRLSKDAIYDGPEFRTIKTEIQQQLLIEQGYLCAYCMRRINAKNMKIEHWHSQAQYPEKQLLYSNLLAVCNGNDVGATTCDTKKGNADLKYNPATPQHRIEDHIHYLGDGAIQSADDEFDDQLSKILNLNYSRLKSNRKEVLVAIEKVLNFKPGIRNQAEISKLIQKWKTTNDKNQLSEYCAVAVYYLFKKLG